MASVRPTSLPSQMPSGSSRKKILDAFTGLTRGRVWAVSAEVLAVVAVIGTDDAAVVALAAGGSEEERAADLFSTGGEAVGENSLTRLVDISVNGPNSTNCVERLKIRLLRNEPLMREVSIRGCST